MWRVVHGIPCNCIGCIALAQICLNVAHKFPCARWECRNRSQQSLDRLETGHDEASCRLCWRITLWNWLLEALLYRRTLLVQPSLLHYWQSRKSFGLMWRVASQWLQKDLLQHLIVIDISGDQAFWPDLGAVHRTMWEVLLSNHCFYVRNERVSDSASVFGFALELMKLQDILPVIVDTAVLALERPIKFNCEPDVSLNWRIFLMISNVA